MSTAMERALALADQWERDNQVREDEPWSAAAARRIAMLNAASALRAALSVQPSDVRHDAEATADPGALTCTTCGAVGTPTPWGPTALGVCRDEMNPNGDDEGQHVLQPADHEATATRQVEAVRALHRPWYYGVDGVRRDHTVYAYGTDVPADHVCRIGHGYDRCSINTDDPTDSGHQVLACVECRGASEDGEPVHSFWPCLTIRELDALGDDQPDTTAERQAQALRDAADDWEDPPNPGRCARTPRTGAFVGDWLRARADRLVTEARP